MEWSHYEARSILVFRAIDQLMLSKEKTLGSISPDQLGRTMAIVDEVATLGSIYDLLRAKPRFKRLINSPRVKFTWSVAYEFDHITMVSALIMIIGHEEIVEKLKADEDKTEAFLKLAEEDQDERPQHVKASKALWAVGLLHALIKSAECISLYSVTLNELVARLARGDKDAFVKAVTVDPTVLTGPSGAHQFSLAVMRNDKVLLKRLRKALDGPHKGRTPYRKLRYSAAVLDESGAISNRNREHVFDVVANQLKLYEQKRGDPFKGLFTQFSRWKAEATT